MLDNIAEKWAHFYGAGSICVNVAVSAKVIWTKPFGVPLGKKLNHSGTVDDALNFVFWNAVEVYKRERAQPFILQPKYQGPLEEGTICFRSIQKLEVRCGSSCGSTSCLPAQRRVWDSACFLAHACRSASWCSIWPQGKFHPATLFHVTRLAGRHRETPRIWTGKQRDGLEITHQIWLEFTKGL